MICTAGHTNPDGAAFCAQCGAPAQPTVTPQTPATGRPHGRLRRGHLIALGASLIVVAIAAALANATTNRDPHRSATPAAAAPSPASSVALWEQRETLYTSSVSPEDLPAGCREISAFDDTPLGPAANRGCSQPSVAMASAGVRNLVQQVCRWALDPVSPVNTTTNSNKVTLSELIMLEATISEVAVFAQTPSDWDLRPPVAAVVTLSFAPNFAGGSPYLSIDCLNDVPLQRFTRAQVSEATVVVPYDAATEEGPLSADTVAQAFMTAMLAGDENLAALYGTSEATTSFNDSSPQGPYELTKCWELDAATAVDVGGQMYCSFSNQGMLLDLSLNQGDDGSWMVAQAFLGVAE